MAHMLGCPSGKPKKHITRMRFEALLGHSRGPLGALWEHSWTLLAPAGGSKKSSQGRPRRPRVIKQVRDFPVRKCP
eukprot:1681045-Pyramimonas_sp.AAC.1